MSNAGDCSAVSSLAADVHRRSDQETRIAVLPTSGLGPSSCERIYAGRLRAEVEGGIGLNPRESEGGPAMAIVQSKAWSSCAEGVNRYANYVGG